MSTNDTAQPTKLIIGEVRFSYCHVFEPKSAEEGGKKKYSVSLIIPKTNKALVAQINACIEAAKQEGKGSKWKGKVPATLKLPLRDGDVERPEDEAYANSYFINATSDSKPTILDRSKKSLTSEEEFYSGVFGKASVNFYAFDASGNKGVACGLNNILKTKDGDKLAGRSSAEDDFAEEFESGEGDDDLLG